MIVPAYQTDCAAGVLIIIALGYPHTVVVSNGALSVEMYFEPTKLSVRFSF